MDISWLPRSSGTAQTTSYYKRQNCLWGDYRYLELAHVCTDILPLAKHYVSEGLEFNCMPSSVEVEWDDYHGLVWFMYIRDQDGIPCEVVQD